MEEGTLVPLYGRGRPRPEGGAGGTVPRRPVPPRREAPAEGGGWEGGGGVNFALGFGFFPAIFTLLWTNPNTGRPPDRAHRRPGEATMVERVGQLLLSLAVLFVFLILSLP